MNEQPRCHEILRSQYSRYDKRNLCRETNVAFKSDGQEISQRINATPLIHSSMKISNTNVITFGIDMLTGMVQSQEERG